MKRTMVPIQYPQWVTVIDHCIQDNEPEEHADDVAVATDLSDGTSDHLRDQRSSEIKDQRSTLLPLRSPASPIEMYCGSGLGSFKRSKIRSRG